MDLLKRRSRVVWFRMTEPEYQRLLSICSTTGVRTVSEAARTAVETYLLKGTQEDDVTTTEIRVVRSRLEDLGRKIDQLSHMVQNVTKSAGA